MSLQHSSKQPLPAEAGRAGAATAPLEPPPRGNSASRTLLAAAVGAVGIVNLVSAAFPAQRSRLQDLRRAMPLSATHVAVAATAAAGLALLVLARQMYLGKRRAMLAVLALLVGSIAANLIKGLDYEEAGLAAGLIPLILLRRKDFFAKGDPASLARFIRTAPLLFGSVFAFGVGALWLNRNHVTPHFTLWRAIKETAVRVVFLTGPLRAHGRFGRFFGITMATVGIGTGLFVLFLLFRPVVQRLHRNEQDILDAKRIVKAHGEDSLSYFSLRRDKDYFFNDDRSAFIAYRYIGGLALVSGDPVGPPREWPELLEQFSHHCRSHGWSIAVVGVHEDSLPLYRGFGYKSYHIGDEAIVHPKAFSMEGREMRNVRQSANHVRNMGYTFKLLDYRELDVDTRKRLLEISTAWIGKDREYGFSMALGRIASPEDQGWLVAVASDPVGTPQAFLHMVPFRGGKCFSLDAMRRNREGPAGLNDYLISETALALRRRGVESFSLNFAAFTAQLADIKGLRPIRRIEQAFIKWLSKSFQIESLYRFNAKFEPSWTARYLVYEDTLDLFRAGLAIAQAEAFIRIPLVGRYF